MEVAVRSSWTGEVVRVAVSKDPTVEELEGRAAEALGLEDGRCVLKHADRRTLRAEDLAELPADAELVARGRLGVLRELGTIESEDLGGMVFEVRVMPGGRWAFVGGAKEDVCRVDLASGKVVQTYRHGSSVSGLAVSRDGEVLYAGGDDGKVKKWRGADGQAVEGGWRVPVEYGYGLDSGSVFLSADGQSVFVASMDGLGQYDAATGERLQVLGSSQVAARVSCDGTVFTLKQCGGPIEQWDVSSGTVLKTFDSTPRGVTTVMAVSEDGRTLLGGCGESMRQWDVASGQCMRTYEGLTGQVLTVGFLQDGTVAGCAMDTMCVWDSSTGEQLAVKKGRFSVDARDGFVAMSPSPSAVPLMLYA